MDKRQYLQYSRISQKLFDQGNKIFRVLQLLDIEDEKLTRSVSAFHRQLQ
jgi:hypothetical protein